MELRQLFEGNFKTLDDGTTYFFPSEGVAKRTGRVVSDESARENLIRAQREYCVSVLLLSVLGVTAVLLSNVVYLSLGFIPFYMLIWYRYWVCYKDLEEHKDVRLNLRNEIVFHTPMPQSVRITILASVLGVVSIIAAYSFVSNPYQKFSTERYWEMATLEDVAEIPEVALQAGNKNGPVLMWAASVVTDPELIEALLARGASINERDEFSKATALSAAAYQNPTKEVMVTLLDNGAQVNIVLGRLRKTPLLLAAEQNSAEITALLIESGANIKHSDAGNRTAADIAQKFNNAPVADLYTQLEQASAEY